MSRKKIDMVVSQDYLQVVERRRDRNTPLGLWSLVEGQVLKTDGALVNRKTLEDQWRSGGQKGRKEDRRESREIHPLKETNLSALPPKPLHDKGKIPRSNRQPYDANGVDEDSFPPACEGNDHADAQDRIADSGDDKPEESLLSLLKRRRQLSQHSLISTTASGLPSNASVTAPSSTSTMIVASTSTTSTSISTTNPASEENVVHVSTKDSCPAYSFTLGRYKANEFIIHSLQHKNGPFTNKNRLLPESCRNVIDVLEVWRYGTKTFTAIQDLTEKFGRSWIAPKDRERYQFFTEVVQEFRRLVMDEGIDDDMAVKELMGRQDWWLVPLSKQQTDEAAELSSESEPVGTDSDSDLVFQPHYRRNSSQSHKKSQPLKRSETRKRSDSHQKSPAISTDMDMDISTAAGNHVIAAEHSTSSDTEPMDHEMFPASTTRPASRNSHRNPRPQYKDNVVEPWGDAVINPNFTFPIPDGIETVPELYKAWHEGWGDIPSLFQLTKENGPSWRSSKLPSSKKIYEWYHFHYKIIRAIDDLVVREWTAEDAILALEQIRGKRKLANLHKEIPCPGHMIPPIKDKGTPKAQIDNGSPAAADDINATSSSKVPPTVRPSDSSSTAGASTTNSSGTGSSEIATSDHTTTTATVTTVSSSSKTSTISQLKSTTDDSMTPTAANSTSTVRDKPTTSVKENSISSIVSSKFKMTGNGNNTSNTNGKTTSSAKPGITGNTTTGKRKSTTDSISTSSIKTKATTSAPTSAVNDTGDNLSTPIDDGVNATNARISRLMNESNSLPIAKDKTTGSPKLSSVDNTSVSRPKSTTSGNVTSNFENTAFTSSKPKALENTSAGSLQSTVDSVNALGTMDGITTSASTNAVNTTVVIRPTLAADSNNPLEIKLTTDRNSAPITNDRPSGTAASSATFSNTTVNPGSSFTYIHNSAKSIQRAMSYSQISSRSSKELPPKGLTQSDFASSNNSDAPVARSSFEKDVVPNDSAGSSVGRPNGMTASASNSSSIALNSTIDRPSSMSAVNVSSILADVTAGTVNRPNTASASSDVNSVPNGVNAGAVHSPYNVSVGILDRPRSGSGYTVAPHEYVPCPKEQVESLHRSRSGTEVTEILESGQVNSTHYTLPPQGATPPRAAVPLPPSLQVSKARYPSSAFSISRLVDERAAHHEREQWYDDDDDDDDDERLTRHRPVLQRPAPPPPPPQQRKHPLHHQPHHHQQQQPLQQSQQVEHYQQQLLQLQQQRQQHHPQRQHWDRSLDHTRAHSPSHRPSSLSSSSASSSHHYGHDWPAEHWSSSTNDEVIDLT
ncbi:hypothetical protein BG015_009824 [Linnemannia schmuckeri]|uniref:Transcription activator GCR1-like domain-containing protein n=1 Tax=Linnemannia schmuckeri TaxID=64567 RepID=A0A9P5S7X9_9FUNG|nr:hypothetical protein BG015_009824 [Linnemannia schmuckeri]